MPAVVADLAALDVRARGGGALVRQTYRPLGDGTRGSIQPGLAGGVLDGSSDTGQLDVLEDHARAPRAGAAFGGVICSAAVANADEQRALRNKHHYMNIASL